MRLPYATAGTPMRALLKHFAAIFLVAATLLTLVIVVTWRLDQYSRLEGMKVRETARLEIAQSRVRQDFSSVILDLRIIAGLPELTQFLDDGSASQRKALTRYFLLLSEKSGRYDQIRYLDEHGQEVIRVNHNDGKPAVVPDRELQNKAGRYFFRDTFSLDRDEVFVSPLDLNIEHDKIETPYKPMIRFGMPVFDSKGRKRGVVLLNYFGAQMLKHFRDVMQGGDERIAMLLNRDGFWLSSPRQEEEWGFMLGRSDLVFSRDFPGEWRNISAQEQGSLISENGVFSFATVFPLQSGQVSSSGSPLPSAPSPQELSAREYYWKGVSHIPADTLAAQSWYTRPANRLLLFSAYLLIALGAFLVAYLNLRRKQSAENLRESESRLREITTTMSDGLMVMSPGGRIQFVNPEAAQLLGYAQDELLDKDMHDLLHVNADGSPAPRAGCPVLGIVRSGETYRGVEQTFRRKDGTLLTVSVSVSAMRRDSVVSDIVIAFHDISLRKEMERELEHRAHTDALTGLSNRHHFYETAQHEYVRARRYSTPLSALMLDIDHFKKINDNYGHHAGDTVLQKLSEVCRNTLRENDLIGRLGGEEFAILLPEADGERAREIAERLRLSIANVRIPLEREGHFRFFVSIGVTSLVEADQDIDDLLKRADEALYVSKNAGRNRVSCKFVASDEAPASA
jgi:diguanylate cyclase (GGDEF)-like protein/PAS domain S-box-containing protein